MIEGFYRLLAATGFTQRVHLVFAYVPVGLLTGAVFFSLGAYFWKKEDLRISAAHAVVLAFIFVFPSVLFGVFDWMHFYQAVLSFPIKMKMILSLALMLLLAAGIILRGEKKVKPGVMLGIYALAFGAMIGLVRFGSALVFGGAGNVSEQTVEAPDESSITIRRETGSADRDQASASGEDVRSGEVIFASNCQGCHPRGENIVVPDLPLKDAKQLESLQTFATFIHDPRLPDGSRGPMPAFPPDKLSEAQDQKLYAYIRSMLDDPAWR